MEGECLVEMGWMLFGGGGWARWQRQLQCWLAWNCMTGCYLEGGDKKSTNINLHFPFFSHCVSI